MGLPSSLLKRINGVAKPAPVVKDPQAKMSDVRNKLHAHGLGILAEELKVIPPKSLDVLERWITEDPEMKRVKKIVRELCHESFPVFIHGETGTGKELIASSLHGYRKGKFLAVNTTSLPDTLIESELYGHIAGAYTGARDNRKGKFEEANNGTIFLDEIGDMPFNTQAKLLRVLQEGVVTPVGSNQEIKVNVRVVSASHHELTKLIEQGKFREDLYWRLAQYTIRLTPLRDRPDDIREILDAVLDPEGILTEDQRDELVSLPLAGNFRELQSRVIKMHFDARLSQRAGTNPA